MQLLLKHRDRRWERGIRLGQVALSVEESSMGAGTVRSSRPYGCHPGVMKRSSDRAVVAPDLLKRPIVVPVTPTPGWHNLGGWIVFVAFIFVGLIGLDLGRVIWSDAHNPLSTAVFKNPQCWISYGAYGDSTQLCDIEVTYQFKGQTIHESMDHVEGSDLADSNSNTLVVRVNPNRPTDVTPAPDVSNDLAFGFWGGSIFLICWGSWFIWKAWPTRPWAKAGSSQ